MISSRIMYVEMSILTGMHRTKLMPNMKILNSFKIVRVALSAVVPLDSSSVLRRIQEKSLLQLNQIRVVLYPNFDEFCLIYCFLILVTRCSYKYCSCRILKRSIFFCTIRASDSKCSLRLVGLMFYVLCVVFWASFMY